MRFQLKKKFLEIDDIQFLLSLIDLDCRAYRFTWYFITEKKRKEKKRKKNGGWNHKPETLTICHPPTPSKRTFETH